MSPTASVSPFSVTLRQPQAVAETRGLCWVPSEPVRAVMVLGHGAGTDMTNPVLAAVGRGLSTQGCAVVAFNFAYVEAGRRSPDPRRRLENCFRDVLSWSRARFDALPLVIGGRSMGGRIASLLAAEGEPCAGLVFLGYPLHRARLAGAAVAAEDLRSAHWEHIRQPVLFVQGDRDRMCDLRLLERERKRFAQDLSTVHVVAGGDHGFGVRKSDGRTVDEVHAEVVGVVGAWLRQLVAPAGTRRRSR